MARNFYGGLKVTDATADDSDEPIRRLTHGTITHGEQYLDPKFAGRPTTYYGPNSGVGRAIRQSQETGPVRVGVIGLGTGTLAAYGRAGDYFRFYEINPLVLRLAKTQFTFLKISQGSPGCGAGRRPPVAGARTAGELRRDCGGRFFERRHSDSPAHARGVCFVFPAFESWPACWRCMFRTNTWI